MANLIPKIAELLGVELGEEFNVVSKDGSERICVLSHDGLLDKTNDVFYNKELFVDIACGKLEIIKLPWNPKKGERYYTFVPRSNDEKLIVTSTLLENDVADNALLKAGWVFKTEEEAQKALPIVAKEIGAKYELPNTKIVEPWKPKFADRYFGFFKFNGTLLICRYDIWSGTIEEEAQYRCGWIFRTREEAEAALPKVAAEMGVDYEI